MELPPLSCLCQVWKRKIINIALEAGCGPVTALGTHRRTCSTVLCCYTFPEVEMSSFTVITFLPPLTIDYFHFSVSRPSLWKWPTWLATGSPAEQKWPPPGFYSEKGREGAWGGGGSRGKAGTHRNKSSLYPTCPLAVCLSGRLEVKSFFFGDPWEFRHSMCWIFTVRLLQAFLTFLLFQASAGGKVCLGRSFVPSAINKLHP